MKNIFLGFIFIVCSVVAVNVFAQSGTWSNTSACYTGQHIDNCRQACSSSYGDLGRVIVKDGCTGNFCGICQMRSACPAGTIADDRPAVGPNAYECVPEEPEPDCEAGPAGTHTWASSGNLSCVGSCAVTQSGDSSCTGIPAEGGMCTATFDYTGLACPGTGDDGGDGGGSSSSAGSGDDGGGDGDGGNDGGGGSSAGGGDGDGSGSSSSSAGDGGGGSCPAGQISQGTLNGKPICVGQCPTGQHWGSVNGVVGCHGAGSGSGGSSSDGEAGQCDPSSSEYAKCIGQINDVDDGLSGQIIGDATSEAEQKLNEAYDAISQDVENFSGIDSQFADAPNALSSALMGFLPAPSGCSNIQLSFMGQSASLDCGMFNDFKLAFGWFLSIITAAYIWSLATKPIQR